MKKLAVMISVILIIIALSLVNSYDSPNSFEIDFETQLNTLNEYFLNSKYSVVEEKDVENNSTLLQTLLPPLWSEVPSLDKSNFDMDSQGRFIIDVWNYTNRMALYKHLIENINHCEWSSPSNIGKIFHDSSLNSSDLNLNPGSILWGLPLQHGWQYSSGRLFVEENSNLISVDSWWGNMNYYLSIIPYFGAMQAGVVPSISVLGPANNSFGEFFCTSPEQCVSVVRPWTNFFKQVNATANTCEVNTDSKSNSGDESNSSSENLDTSNRTKYQHFPIASSLDFNLTPGMETTLSNLWSAHLNSIGYASKLFPQSLAAMSAEEEKFGLSWSNLVDFIAAADFNCNFVITNVLQNLLPKRVLTTGDVAPMISDMTRLENRAILFIEALYTANVYSKSYLEKVWDFSMCTEPARALGREIITLGVYRPLLIVKDGFELLPLIKNQSKIICLK